MPHYYFDTRDNESLIADEVGLDLQDVKAARDEAVRGLADLAKDVLPEGTQRTLAIEVKDEFKRPLLRTALAFEVRYLSPPPAPHG
jgi:uncharacterized protein DUF6894